MAKRFLAPKGTSMPKIFSKVPKMCFFRFLACWPLFFALLTVFLFHQIEHWVNIHLWAKRFFAPKGTSMPKKFSKVPKKHFFLGFWSLDNCFSPCWPFFIPSNWSLGYLHLWAERFFAPKGTSMPKFFPKVPKFYEFSF